MCLTTATCGFRTSQMVGFRIATATGFISPSTVGLGLAMSLGDGRRITMGAGSRMAMPGHGGLDPYTQGTTQSGRRLTCDSSDGAAAVVLGWALADGAASAGFRLGHATISIRGGVGTVAASATPVFMAATTATGASRRYITE